MTSPSRSYHGTITRCIEPQSTPTFFRASLVSDLLPQTPIGPLFSNIFLSNLGSIFTRPWTLGSWTIGSTLAKLLTQLFIFRRVTLVAYRDYQTSIILIHGWSAAANVRSIDHINLIIGMQPFCSCLAMAIPFFFSCFLIFSIFRTLSIKIYESCHQFLTYLLVKKLDQIGTSSGVRHLLLGFYVAKQF